MRAKEFIAETTVAGGIAPVAMPIGPTLSREGAIPSTAKYKKTSMKRKPDVSRRFENSISH